MAKVAHSVPQPRHDLAREQVDACALVEAVG